MKYDPNTARVDRWHGFTDDELNQGFKNVSQDSPDDTNNNKQLNGGLLPTAEDTDCGG